MEIILIIVSYLVIFLFTFKYLVDAYKDKLEMINEKNLVMKDFLELNKQILAKEVEIELLKSRVVTLPEPTIDEKKKQEKLRTAFDELMSYDLETAVNKPGEEVK